ncbi:hypothetical protein TWF225_001247 [Orbilia oligospora]|uniref:Uncharacterized protein n=1 Tax=Orbilia oligospora TaxID=2813651 RepID=A0A7C8TTR0_ORBOL|nr:hypothetical protein TWF225_001247 [Orbilia oligospora]KAF3180606.1 hypothetical protein TWF751_010981 [Orbilia oligospora]KAF3233984.1 hypothetical protein TWF128_002672 [Orbilia oligospora]KAF3241005.1 hypothetical protein TWF217_000687 [Orbilia oligospora]KAF3283466.1 hypothetical protein TWF132_010406 [Orbilia oligospora]
MNNTEGGRRKAKRGMKRLRETQRESKSNQVQWSYPVSHSSVPKTWTELDQRSHSKGKGSIPVGSKVAAKPLTYQLLREEGRSVKVRQDIIPTPSESDVCTTS